MNLIVEANDRHHGAPAGPHLGNDLTLTWYFFSLALLFTSFIGYTTAGFFVRITADLTHAYIK